MGDYEMIMQLELSCDTIHSVHQMQLKTKDVSTRTVRCQLEAIAQLRLNPSRATSTALKNCLTSPEVYWRVRLAAAQALCEDRDPTCIHRNADMVMSFFKNLCFDKTKGTLQTHNFSNFTHYLLQKELPCHLAACIDTDHDGTKVEIVDLLGILLEAHDNSGNNYSDELLICRMIEACGRLRIVA